MPKPDTTPDRAVQDTAVTRVARAVAGRRMSTGTRARLRRMDPENPAAAAAALVPLLIEADLIGPASLPPMDTLVRWATVAQIVAVIAGTGAGMAQGGERLGAVLNASGLSEARLLRLLSAKGPALRDQAIRIARLVAARGIPRADLRPLADLVVYDGTDPDRADAARLRLAADFYRASVASGDAAPGQMTANAPPQSTPDDE